MRIAGVDLNLLTSLEALLEENNVSKAARRLGVSQPAASHALARLRELLGDPLLVRTPAGMQPTPRARELRPQVRAALAAAETVLQAAPAFDPATAERTFVATIPDQVGFQILPALMPQLAKFPGVRLELRPPPHDVALALANGDIELAVGVWRDRPMMMTASSGSAGADGRRGVMIDERLWREEFACVVRRGSPAARGPLTLDRYLALDHMLVSPGGTPGSFVDDLLASKGLHRKIALVVPQFLIAPAVVAATDLVWTAPVRLARALADAYPLTLRDPPLAMPSFEVAMRHHLRFARDPGLAWLRERLRASA
jgi:DNA-binding transcriptional LysR family regulator